MFRQITELSGGVVFRQITELSGGVVFCQITELSGGVVFRQISYCLLLGKRILPWEQNCERRESLKGTGAVEGTIAKRIAEQKIVNM